jgi:Ca2+-binding EF-hand superfamily protein
MALGCGIAAANCVSPAHADAAGPHSGMLPDRDQIDAKLFDLVDLNKDGKISPLEASTGATMIFAIRDKNNDGSLTKEEFIDWDWGYLPLAQKHNKAQQLEAAKAELFRQSDLNEDDKIDHEEYLAVFMYWFYKSDTNHDGVLSKDELLSQFPFVKGPRSAFD